MSSELEKINQAYQIAVSDLKYCYEKRDSQTGILAGRGHFGDYWGRDSFFASLGCLSINDIGIVKKNILLFLKFQKKNGQIPLRIERGNFYLNFFGINFIKKLSPVFLEDKFTSYPPDSSLLLPMIFEAYVRKTSDIKFLKEHYAGIQRAVEWSISTDHNNDWLIEEGHYSTWADSLKKHGNVLYTNVCFFKAAKSMAELSSILGKKFEHIKYSTIAGKIKNKINKEFWNGEYYIDWIDGKKKHNYFSTDGNVLAVLWGLADRKKSISIINCLKKFRISTPYPSKTNYPSYHFRFAHPILHLIGLGDYHNSTVSWIWLGCVSALAKNKYGKKKEAVAILSRISDLIVKHGTVYEIYEKDGRPVKRWFYKAEVPFTWSAGLFVYACNEIGIVKSNN